MRAIEKKIGHRPEDGGYESTFHLFHDALSLSDPISVALAIQNSWNDIDEIGFKYHNLTHSFAEFLFWNK